MPPKLYSQPLSLALFPIITSLLGISTLCAQTQAFYTQSVQTEIFSHLPTPKLFASYIPYLRQLTPISHLIS